jgi:peptidoglycan/xylan/chitin deacetylase (PgdA/CDA1 family)
VTAFGSKSRCLLGLFVRAFGVPLALVLGWFLRLSGRRVGVALLYHRVAAVQGDPNHELLPALGSRVFEAQLRWLKSSYRVVPPSQLLAATARRRRGRRLPVAITFDDDLASHAGVAMPKLRRLGLPAAFFLCGASLDEPFSFWWERLQSAVDRGLAASSFPAEISVGASSELRQSRSIHEAAAIIERMAPRERDAVSHYLRSLLGVDPAGAGLRADGIRTLASAGFEIGFHTLRHDALPPLDDKGLQRALTDGRARLASVVGRELTMIAYPHGRADARVAAAARRAGYEFGFTGEPRRVTSAAEPLLLGRLEPSFDSLGHFALQIAGALAGR